MEEKETAIGGPESRFAASDLYPNASPEIGHLTAGEQTVTEGGRRRGVPAPGGRTGDAPREQT